ncbi:MAG: hypothetical protein R3B47_01505 [Bacteroidia bacterium]
MKQLLSTILLVLFVSGTMLYAQEPDPQTPSQQAARSTAFLAQKLNLNQDQQQAVLCAQEDFFMFRKQLFVRHNLSQGPSDGLRLQLHLKQKDCEQKIFAVLTPAQAEVYEQYLSGLVPR